MRAIFAFVIAAAVVATTPASPAPSKDSPASPADKARAAVRENPMVFYLARGEADSCGPGCSEWIAAEGQIIKGTADRMRAFLKRQSGPKRPIYFYSPGGIASDALTMGRLMHDGGFTAGVAETVAQDCEPAECERTKKSGHELRAKFNTFAASCASACVYALVGARVREVAPDAVLGIHAAKTKILSKIPKGIHIPPNFYSDFHKKSNREIARYLVDMGLKPALLEAAEKIPHEDIKVLTRDEIIRYGIDTAASSKAPGYSMKRCWDALPS